MAAGVQMSAYFSPPCARSNTRIFGAGPNAFAFSLGQNQPAIGPAVIYEFDFS
jgi:hypothetical protein